MFLNDWWQGSGAQSNWDKNRGWQGVVHGQGGMPGIFAGAGPVGWLIQKGIDGPPQGPARQDLGGAAEKTAAADQTAVDRQTGQNRVNTSTPFGFEQWNPDGSMSQGFGGQLGDAFGNLSGQIASQGQSPMDMGTAARDQAINAAYGQATSRLDPQWAQRDEQMRSQLANQGLDPTSEAYQKSMTGFGQQRNDAYSSAMNSAIGQGTAAQQATFGQNMAGRMMPYQQMGMMHGWLQQPGYSQAGRGQGANYFGAAMGQAGMDMQQWQQQQQQQADMIRAMGGLGTAAITAGG